jgi:hypothetical protein
MAGIEYFYCIQRNDLDRRARTLKIDAWNESFANRIIINEYCIYYVHPDNSSWTCFEQSASLEVKSFFGFESAVEKLGTKHYAANVQKGQEIIDHYVNELRKLDITYLAPYSDEEPEESPVQTLRRGEFESDEISTTSGCATSLSENEKTDSGSLSSYAGSYSRGSKFKVSDESIEKLQQNIRNNANANLQQTGQLTTTAGGDQQTECPNIETSNDNALSTTHSLVMKRMVQNE